MFQDFLFDYIREELSFELQQHKAPQVTPAPCDRYVAMSGMQKAIRRGDIGLALSCSVNLLTDNPTGFWRRLTITAYEDIGIANPDLVGRVIAVTSNKRWRNRHGGEWLIASYLVEKMCQSVKERSTDDLLTIICNSPDLTEQRRAYANLDLLDRLAALSNPDTSLPERALAASYAVGTNRAAVEGLKHTTGDYEAAFAKMLEAGIMETMVLLGREGIKKTSCPICTYFPLLWNEMDGAETTITKDPFPTEVTVAGMPSYCFDTHTRLGLNAFRQYLNASDRMSDFLYDHNAPSSRMHRIVGLLVFRIESGLVDQRLSWDKGRELRKQADTLEWGLPDAPAQEAFDILQDEWDLLNQIRQKIGGVYG